MYVYDHFRCNVECPFSEGKSRKAWMDNELHAGVTHTLALAKQKCKLAEKIHEGMLRCVETEILQQIKFPALIGDYKVEVADNLGNYKASFFTGSEQIAKTFPTLAKVNSWLLSMIISYKKGEVQSHLRAAECAAKGEVALEKAVAALGASEDLSTSVSEIQPAVISTEDGHENTVTDVTLDILTVTKTSSAPVLPSTVCVHKGSFNTFVNLGSSLPSLCGLLLGKLGWNNKIHIYQIVIMKGDTVEALVNSDKVKAAYSGNGLYPCGMIVKGSDETWSQRVHDVVPLFPLCDVPLVICIDYTTNIGGDTCAWELDMSVDVEVNAPTPVAISWTTQPHDSKRRSRYHICWIDDWQVSHVEHATMRICEAVVQHVVHGSAMHLNPRPPSVDTDEYRLVEIPADGKCGWHALLASMDVKKFEAVPRSTTGYPISHEMQLQEVLAANEFHSKVCADALNECDGRFRERIARVQSNTAFEPTDLEWISLAMGLSIRCTCAAQARHCHIYAYISKYTIHM